LLLGAARRVPVATLIAALLASVHCGPSSPPPVEPPTDASPESDASPQADARDGSLESGELLVLPAQYTGQGMPLRMLSDGDPVDLVQPPQGGHVVFIGAKVQNCPSDVVDLMVRFRRPESGAIIQQERRTVAMEVIADEPEFMRPKDSPSQVGQPALCPDYESEDVLGQELTLEVEVSPLYVALPVKATATRLVVPTCDRAVDRALCVCECTANYVLGRCPVTKDPPDAGVI
jgi:hypothetical protein